MSDDSKLDFILDLDAQAFLQKAGQALDMVTSLGQTLGELGTVAGVVGAAFLAIKGAADLTQNAEELKSLNAQFDILARQAGLVPEKLKEGLDKAAEGLLDDNELLQIANRNMVVLGASAGRMTEIMEIARKASVVSGKDIKQVFEEIVQATASGRTQTLRELGIMVDSKKAVEEYAAAHGLAVNVLSQEGRSQAILNAALDDAKKRYASADTSVKEVTDSWTRMKNAVHDLYDTIALGFDAIFGPTIKKMVDSFAGLASAMKKIGFSVFGDETQKAQVHLEAYQGSLKNAQNQLQFFQDRLSHESDPKLIKQLTADIDIQKQKIAEAQAAIEKYQAVAEGSNKAGPSGAPSQAVIKADIVNKEALKQNEAAFNREIASLNQQRLQVQMQMAQSAQEVDAQLQQQRLTIQEQADAQISQIRSNQNLTKEQKDREILIVAKTSADRQVQIEDDLQKRRIAALDLYTTHAKSDADGVARAFEAGSKKAQIAQTDFGAVGVRVFNSFEKNSVSALQAFGAGQESASEAAKGFIFGMLADEAEARGKIMMLASIWPPNPAGLAAGAGLIALSGFLRSQGGTGGAGAGGGTDSGSSSGGTSAGSGAFNSTGVSPVQQNQPTKAVTINIAGSYFETEQTKQRLVEMINETADATGYTVRPV